MFTMRYYRNVKKSYLRGFTLVELLIAIAIIGILASVIIPRFNQAREKSQVASAQIEINQIRSAFDVLANDTGVFPNGAVTFCRSIVPVGNEVDLSASSSGLVGNALSWGGWNGPYVSSAEDPWGSPYYFDEDYQCLASTTGCEGVADVSNTSSVIVSCGPNGTVADGACDYDADNIVKILCR